MGTAWAVKFANPAMLPLEAVRAAIAAALDGVVAQMSPWEPGSDISRFNNAPAGSVQQLPDDFFHVLEAALAWAAESGGACDPTVGALVDLWGFGPRALPLQGPGRDAPPDAQAIAGALSCSGWQRLVLDAATRSARQPGGLRLDLSGIAKGFAVDQVVAALAALGLGNALVDVGGELRGIGRRPDGRPWRVGVDGAAGQEAYSVALDGLAVATSGDAWHAFEHGGRRYSHTIDPRTGAPVAHALASVSVLHPQCMQADALATVLTVLGPDEGLAFAQARGIAALFLERVGDASGTRERMSAAFAQFLA